MPGKFASTSTVAPERTRAEIETMLKRYKASQFAYGWSPVEAIVGFEIHGRGVRIAVPLPDRTAKDITHAMRRGYLQPRTPSQREDAYEQQVRQRWRALLLLIKAQLEAVELSLCTLEQAFMPWLVLPGGFTVSQVVLPQLEDRGASDIKLLGGPRMATAGGK